MSGPEQLEQTVGHHRTRMGAFFAGSHAVFRGHDLHADLREMDWVELYLFGITGRRFTQEQIRLLHGILVYTSYPDARLWNNRIAALAGSARSTPALGVTAALAVSEAGIYGGYPGVRAIDFMLRAKRFLDQGGNLADMVKQEGRVYGYGRPTPETKDERLPWLLKLAQELGLGDGPHLKIALEVETMLRAKRADLRMNYAAMTSALCADMGFTIAEFHMFRVPLFMAGMPPGYIEARERPEGSLFPIPVRDVIYEGVPARPWQAASGAP